MEFERWNDTVEFPEMLQALSILDEAEIVAYLALNAVVKGNVE